MPNSGDFDPAEAIRRQRAAEEAEKQRVQAKENSYRANIMKLIRHADEQLENIRNPIVSEFVVTERWWTQESTHVSDRRYPGDFEKTLRANQRIISTEDVGSIFIRSRYIHTVATSHEHERQTSYYGSWLWLSSTSGERNEREGLVKLRQPRAGYALVTIGGSDPRDAGYVNRNLTDRYRYGHEAFNSQGGIRTFASLEEVEEAIKRTSGTLGYLSLPSHREIEGVSEIERLTKAVRQALDFVETGQPPEPKWIEPIPGAYPGET